MERKKIEILDQIIKENPKDEFPHESFFDFFHYQKNPTFFTDASIFDKAEYLDIKKKFMEKKEFSMIEKLSMGSMLGMAIGDAMGAPVEFQPLSYTYDTIKDMGEKTRGNFDLKPGQWTDDTSMGLCLADSLIEKKGEFKPRDIMMRFLLWWFYGYNNAFRFDNISRHSVGLGGNISGSFRTYLATYGQNEYTIYGNKETSGNGSIMRNAAIPICYYRDGKSALYYAGLQSKITHQGDEASGCCQLLTFIIVKILNGGQLKDILNNLGNEFQSDCCKSVYCLANSEQEGNDKNRNWNWKDQNFKYSEERARNNPGYIGSYCMDGLAMALHVLYYTNTFVDAILKAVNLRGDADSVGSVVGQIAGAYYGIDNIPKEWINTINNWDGNEIALRGYILCHLMENNSPIEYVQKP
jgi:ADP-ribosylglycohydrolase